MYIVYSTLIFLNAHLVFSRQQQWIDPHDMDIKDSNFIVKSSNNHHPNTNQCECPIVPINFSMSHYKRLINLILSTVTDNRQDAFKAQLYLHIPYESYDFLKSFASNTKDVEDSALLRKVDQILSKAMVKPSLERLTEALTSWADHIYFIVYSRTTLVYLSCLFVLFISYKLLRANLTIWSVVKYLIFLGWVTDFAFTWINLLQEAEINRMADSVMYETMPPHCNPNKMTFWQYLTYSMSSTNECRKYHQTIYKDHFWSVAPVSVLSHQFGTLVYTPASLLGEALGSFTSGLLGSLPWGVNVILLPVLLIFSATIMCITFSFLTETSFRINLFHVLQLRFGNEQRRFMGDALTGQNLSALLNIAHRNMVEDVRQVENPRIETSNSSNANENDNLMIRAEASNSGTGKNVEINDNLRIEAEASTSGTTGNEENATVEKCNADVSLSDGKSNENCDTEMSLEGKSRNEKLCDVRHDHNTSKIETARDGSGDKL